MNAGPPREGHPAALGRVRSFPSRPSHSVNCDALAHPSTGILTAGDASGNSNGGILPANPTRAAPSRESYDVNRRLRSDRPRHHASRPVRSLN